MKPILTFAGFLLVALAVPAEPAAWRDDLSYGGGGYWDVRLPVRVTYSGSTRAEGIPVDLVLSAEDNTRALLGQPVSTLRVVGPDGAEVIFDVRDTLKEEKRDGV